MAKVQNTKIRFFLKLKQKIIIIKNEKKIKENNKENKGKINILLYFPLFFNVFIHYYFLFYFFIHLSFFF